MSNRSLINSIEREMSRIPGPSGSTPRTLQCCEEKKTCCPTPGPSGSGNPGMSRIPRAPYGSYRIPEASRIPTAPAEVSRLQFRGGSRIPEGPPGMSTIASPGRRSAQPSGEMSRIPGPSGSRSRTVQCSKEKKTCPTPGPSGSGNPGMSRIPRAPYDSYRIPEASRIPTASAEVSRLQFRGGSRIPEGPPGMSTIASPGRRSAQPSGTPKEGFTRTIYAGLSQPPYAAISKTMMTGITKPHSATGNATGLIISRTTITGPSASNIRKGFAVSVTKSISSVDKDPPKPSRLQRFDRTVTAELSRRRNPTPTTTITSDTGLLDAVDRLARAEAAHSFAGAVAAAEAAAAAALDPAAAEEAAAQGARSYQAKLVDVVAEDVPGTKPIQVIGYVGITRPKYPL